MNPIVYQFGQIEIHAFTAWIGLGVALGMAITLGMARYRQQRWLPWLDATIGAVVGGVVGARAVHVWLNWAYFSAHNDQVTALSSGGLDWHGAVIGGLFGAIVVALLRRVPLSPLADAFALALPVGAITGWLACAAANAGYGVEVGTLADYPAWLVTESPDVYGIVAPRLNLPPIGIALAVAVLVLVAALTLFGKLPGARLWLALSLFSLGMGVLDFFRAEYVPTWFGRRADQVLDLALALVAILVFAGVTLFRRRRALVSLRSIPV